MDRKSDRAKRNDEMAKQSIEYNLKKARESGKKAKWKNVNGKMVFDGYEK